MKTALMWFRRDLRVTDNTALYHALRENDTVIGVFVLDDAILRARDIGAARTAFLFGSLQALNAEFEKHGGRLILRYGKSPAQELRTLAAETGASALYFNRDYTPYSTARDGDVTALMDAAGVAVKSDDDALLAPPQNIVDPRDGEAFQTFTPFKRVWETRVRVGARLPLAPLLPKAEARHRAAVRAPADFGRVRAAPDTDNLPIGRSGGAGEFAGVCPV